jgi:hypothetical protein
MRISLRPNLHEMGLMSKRDYNNYFQFFQTLEADGAAAGPADLFAGVCRRWWRRSRSGDGNMKRISGLDYLKRLNDFYSKWIDGYKEGPLLIVDIDKNKFPENEEHLGGDHHADRLAAVWIVLTGGYAEGPAGKRKPHQRMMELVLANNRRLDCGCGRKIDAPSSGIYFRIFNFSLSFFYFFSNGARGAARRVPSRAGCCLQDDLPALRIFR